MENDIKEENDFLSGLRIFKSEPVQSFYQTFDFMCFDFKIQSDFIYCYGPSIKLHYRRILSVRPALVLKVTSELRKNC